MTAHAEKVPPPPEYAGQVTAAPDDSDYAAETTTPFSQAAAAIEGQSSTDLPASHLQSPAVTQAASSRQVISSVDSFYQYHTGLNEHSTETLNAPPPAYSDEWGHIQDRHGGMGTDARVSSDGRVNIHIDQHSRKLSNFLVPALRQQLRIAQDQGPPPPPYIPEALGGSKGTPLPPPLSIVIHVVGSRGDVQPFVALGKVLKDSYKHRVRLATHPTFKSFVEENGLEFFSIGGDPSELMAFMVKNPGLMPGFESIRKGDVGKRRQGIGEIIRGCWRSCYEIGDGMGDQADDVSMRYTGGQELRTAHLNAGTGKPFVADAIIANPPSFAHVHCAEKLGIPLHMMFTMPWSPTQAFPHPLANIQSSDADQNLTNYMSYALVDMLTWQGLGDVINRFRVHSLQLEPISLMWAPGMLARLRVPYTYCWSPALIAKPKDWGQNISISGFYFLNLATNYTPATELQEFLDAGPPPVYIGFGSIVVDDPNALTQLIFEAVRSCGVRALVSKGWGGIGGDEFGIPDNVFMLGNVPHDWLFQHVSCVVHHGGAGTTAAGISAGRPTVIVPFFGDQPFWGAMVARAGAGPPPIHHKSLTAENLAEAIRFALEPSTQERAKEMAATIAQEKGNEAGAESFHQQLPGGVDQIRCSLLPDRAAAWRVRRTGIRLSTLAACILAEERIITFADLKLYRSREYETDEGPWDPISGGAGALIGTMGSMMMGLADLPVGTLKALGIAPSGKSKAAASEVETETKVGSPSDVTVKSSASPSRSSTAPQSLAASASRSSLSLPASSLDSSLDEHHPIKEAAAMAPPEEQTTSTGGSSQGALSPSVSNVESRHSIRRKAVGSEPRSPIESGIATPLGFPGNFGAPRPLSQSTVVTEDVRSSPNNLDAGSPEILAHPAAEGVSTTSYFEDSRSANDTDSGSLASGRTDSISQQGQDSANVSLSSSGRVRSNTKREAIQEYLVQNKEKQAAHRLDTVLGTGKGLQKIIGAGLKSPMDFSLALAKGFHNVPKLYNDDTVREVDKVTGIQSGLMTATKELGLGFYDGITGLITQPVRGAQKSGFEGFVKGIGKGLAGVVVKPGAGIYGVPGYTLKGVYQEIQKRFGASVNNYIIASRTAQGYADFHETTREMRKEVATKYLEVQFAEQQKKTMIDEHVDMIQQRWQGRRERKIQEKEKKSKDKGKRRADSDTCSWDTEIQDRAQTMAVSYSSSIHDSQADSRDDLQLDKSRSTPLPTELVGEPDPAAAELSADGHGTSRLNHVSTFPRAASDAKGTRSQAIDHQQHHQDHQDDEDLEEAIRLSIRQTSRGDQHEDTLIANAIRASLAALEDAQQKNLDEEQILNEAVKASVNEASKSRPEDMTEEQYQKTLEQALQQSVHDQRVVGRSRSTGKIRSSDSEWDDSAEDAVLTDEDEALKTALEESAQTAAPVQVERTEADIEEELQRAMKESALAPVPTRSEQEEEQQLARVLEESKREVLHVDADAAADEEAMLREAMAESLSAAAREQEEDARRRYEEEVVMQYVAKQSLLEEEARRRRLHGLTDTQPLGEVGESSKTGAEQGGHAELP